MEGTGFAGLADQFTGPLVYGFSADPVAVAKVLVNFAKDNEKLVIRGGAMADYVMDVEAVKQLARCRAAKNSSQNWLAACRLLSLALSTYSRQYPQHGLCA